MNESVSMLTQSTFYSPAFNAAIFDGPFRIYFSQTQEPYALKFYFHLQKFFGDQYESLVKKISQANQHIFVMIYPNKETFDLCFSEESHRPITQTNLEEHLVVGLNPDKKDEIDTDKVMNIIGQFTQKF